MRHTGWKVAAPLLAVALLAANAGAQGRVVTLPRADRPLAGAPATVYTLGAAEGSEEQMFGIIAGVAFDAAENLYVLDRQNARVMVYGPNGRFLRQIGRKGQGPGELMIPTQMAVAPDGGVTVHDIGAGRMSVFRGDGTFVRNLQTGRTMGGSLVWHPRGGVVATSREISGPEDLSGTMTSIPLVFRSASGGEPVKLFDVPQRTSASQSSGGTPAARTTRLVVSAPATFSPTVMYDVLPAGQIALSFTSGYTVRVLDAQGQTMRYLQRPFPVRLTTDADRQHAREERTRRLRNGRDIITVGGNGRAGMSISPAQLEAQMGTMTFHDTIPALRGLRASPSGKIWVERTARVVGEPGPLDLITVEGQYLGTTTAMKLPAALSRGGFAAFIERDEDDVEHVVVRRLPAGWR